MSVSVLAAAKHIGTLSGWSKTNLELQKIIYIAHMLHLGEQNLPLVNGHFEAWHFGPVHPELYHRAKVYGADPVKDIFFNESSLEDGSPEKETLDNAYSQVGEFESVRLIAITHVDYGAWASNYKRGVPFIVIPDEDILNEYYERVKRAQQRANL